MAVASRAALVSMTTSSTHPPGAQLLQRCQSELPFSYQATSTLTSSAAKARSHSSNATSPARRSSFSGFLVRHISLSASLRSRSSRPHSRLRRSDEEIILDSGHLSYRGTYALPHPPLTSSLPLPPSPPQASPQQAQPFNEGAEEDRPASRRRNTRPRYDDYSEGYSKDDPKQKVSRLV